MINFNEYVFESKKNRQKIHILSGVVLICNNKILLVKPKKFKNDIDKWSIPKGHVDDDMSKIKTAIVELREESRIKIKKKLIKSSNKVVVTYNKSGFNKKMTCYIVDIEYENINVKLVNDMILRNFLRNEIIEAGFFSLADAEKIIEKPQLELLKFLK